MFGGHSRVWPLRTFKLVLPWDTLAHPWVERRVSGPVSDNPFLSDVKVVDQNGKTLRVLGKAKSLPTKNDRGTLHNPAVGITVRVFTGYSSGHGQE